MIATALLVVLALGQTSPPFVRSRVETGIKNDPNAHCLWWTENSTFTYRQNQDGNAETTGDSEFTALNKSFQNWQAVMDQCGSLRFAEGPRTTLREVGHDPARDDNQNVILYRTRLCSDLVGSSDLCWREDNCGNKYDCWQYARGTIALTTTTFVPLSGRILGADIEGNAVSFVFTTVDAPPCVAPVFNQSCVATDVENTMTHEIGHLLGLDHTGAAGSTMNASAPGGETSKRSIDQGTASFVCQTYPQGAASRDCVIIKVDEELGDASPGCSSAFGPPMLLAAAAALGWRLRRRRWGH